MHACTTTGVLCMYPIKSLLKGSILAYNMAGFIYQECFWREKRQETKMWILTLGRKTQSSEVTVGKIRKELENVFQHIVPITDNIL